MCLTQIHIQNVKNANSKWRRPLNHCFERCINHKTQFMLIVFTISMYTITQLCITNRYSIGASCHALDKIHSQSNICRLDGF